MKDLTVGIDIGGTSTKFGIVDREGKVYEQGSIPMADFEDFADFFDSLSDAIKQAIAFAKAEYRIVGIGVGAANGNYYRGTIENAVNLKWKGILPLGKMFQDEFHIPCLLTNDANAAAVGEMIYGNAKGMKDFIVITLGTGLGSGFVCGGVLLNGHHGIADCFSTAFLGAETVTSRALKNSSASLDDVANRAGSHFGNVAVNHPLITTGDPPRFQVVITACANYCADGGIHTRRIAPGGEDADFGNVGFAQFVKV